MRLIDAKNVEELLTSLAMVPSVIIEKWLNEHTVKAIPIEWIKKWCNIEHKSCEERLMLRYGVITMLEDWEKENAL